MDLYRSEDIDAITRELDGIVEAAVDRKLHLLEPTIDECYRVRDEVKKYVKAKKRIIYGGTAYDEMIKAKDTADRIYTDKDCKDVEFYSPRPLEDVVELCKALNKKFKYVRAQDAVHDETYTIFVNFMAACDITYMPGPIFYNVNKLTINGIHYSHPSFVLVDILRQYNDPINSYWRLKDKTYFRANKLLKHYPLELDKGKYEPVPVSKEAEDMLYALFDAIKNMETLVHLGSLADNFYLRPDDKKVRLTGGMVVMTDNLVEDTKTIHGFMLKHLSTINRLEEADKLLQVEQYHPFFQFWDKRVVLKYNNETIITVLGHNRICLPYHRVLLDSKDKINKVQYGGFLRELRGGDAPESSTLKLGTFMLVFNYHLIEMHLLHVYKHEKQEKQKQRLMRTLLEARNTYLDKHNKTVVDKTPYKEFIIECYGRTIDPVRESRLRIIRRKLKGRSLRFNYDPNTEAEVPAINFCNTSGKLMNNQKGWIIREEGDDVATTSCDESVD
jgi:hypothetical protein